MSTKPHDMTPVVDLTYEKGTGPIRARRPIFVDLLPPCNHACPAGEDIQAWLALAQAGRYREAWETLVAENPLPAVHGRVCYHPCETACNRGQLDAAVSIHAVERFLGDLAAKEGWAFRTAPSSGKRVLTIGAGPSGLSAAYHLARLGHAVEIHEAGPMAGGMMHFGVPAYRLPREDLMREIKRIEAMGVKIVVNHKVEDVLAEKGAGNFDAVFIAVGAGVGRHIDIPARDAVRVLDAVSLLHDVRSGEKPLLGRRVVVYGGGNTAMDAARTARRLGADEALIVYRRDRAHMPAREFEADEAIEEGIKIKWLTTIKEIAGAELTVEMMELDAAEKPQPTGKFETLTADSVVLALGQSTDSRFLRKVPGLAFASDDFVEVGTGHDDRVPRNFRGRRHGTGREIGDRVGWPRQTGSSAHRRLAARRTFRAGGKTSTRLVRDAAPASLQRRRSKPAEDLGISRPRKRLRGSHRRIHREGGAVRGSALPRMRQLLRVRQLLRGVPRASDH